MLRRGWKRMERITVWAGSRGEGLGLRFQGLTSHNLTLSHLALAFENPKVFYRKPTRLSGCLFFNFGSLGGKKQSVTHYLRKKGVLCRQTWIDTKELLGNSRSNDFLLSLSLAPWPPCPLRILTSPWAHSLTHFLLPPEFLSICFVFAPCVLGLPLSHCESSDPDPLYLWAIVSNINLTPLNIP